MGRRMIPTGAVYSRTGGPGGRRNEPVTLWHGRCTLVVVEGAMGKQATLSRPKRKGAATRAVTVGPAPRRGRAGRIRVGTASWSDPGFVADWYPKRLPAQERLPWYARHFDLVEVNSSFYAVPPPATVAKWCDLTPDGFTFDVKLHRLLSRHRAPVNTLPRGLRPLAGSNPEKAVLTPKLEAELVEVILEAIEPMVAAGKFGAFVLQLTPSFGPRYHSLAELDHLLDLLRDYQFAVELRNRNWVADDRREETLDYFRRRGVALVAVDAPPGEHFMIMPGVDVVTTSRLAYLRAHGRNTKGYVSGRSVAERFDYDYPNAELEQIADRARGLSQIAMDTHIIFNNNKGSYAPDAAARFERIVAGSVSSKQ
jgi:uncharacterized protein YecE (DUF72 family)